MADRLRYPKDMKPYLDEKELQAPLKLKQPARIGVQFMGDLFHESISANIITSVFDIMELAQEHNLQHTFFVLTKRPQRIESVLFGEEGHWYLGGGDYLANIMLMVSVEDQKTADERIPLLLNSGWVGNKGVSFEPTLEGVNLEKYIDKLDWIVMGGETGRGARETQYDWIEGIPPAIAIRDICSKAKVPFFFKQWGGKRRGKEYLIDGKEHRELPKF